jgi:L-lactate dehydrogenase complex protein LldE
MNARPRAVQLFATCLVEALAPEAGLAVVRLLERLGIAVEFPPDQTCCGQPAFNSGAWDDARALARHTLDVLARSPAPVVVPSGSCAGMLVRHYPALFAGDPVYEPLAREVAGRTYEFSQYLVEVLGVEDLGAAARGRVAFMPTCHLTRELGVREAPVRLLARVGGIERVALPAADECCGFGGLFAVRESPISGAMLARRLDAIAASGAELVTACDVSCLLHVAGGLRRRGSPVRVCHLAELLAGGGGDAP